MCDLKLFCKSGHIAIIVGSETDNEADKCSDQRDDEKVFDLETCYGICATIYACMIMAMTI